MFLSLAVVAVLSLAPKPAPQDESLVGILNACSLGDELTHGFYADGPMWPDATRKWPRELDDRHPNLFVNDYSIYAVAAGDAGTRSARCSDMYVVVDQVILIPGTRRTRMCKRMYLACGTYDLEAGRSAADIHADIQAMVTRAKLVIGFQVVVLTVPPIMGAPWYSPTVQAEHMDLNARIRAMTGVTVVDTYSALAGTDPLPLSAYPGDYLTLYGDWRNEPDDYVRVGIAGHQRVVDAIDATPGAVP
jgi:hypothetical protein